MDRGLKITSFLLVQALTNQIYRRGVQKLYIRHINVNVPVGGL